jgi:asparagine synthase (glutamine-hydrolysing)
MAHSLEARVPLLDHHVVETAFRLPSHLKLGRNADGSPESKYALKKAMSAYLPDDIVYRRKQGFDIPVTTWLKGPFLDAMGDRLLGGHLRQAGIVREEGVRALLARARDSGHNYASMLMVLLALEAWTGVYSGRVGAVHWH